LTSVSNFDYLCQRISKLVSKIKQMYHSEKERAEKHQNLHKDLVIYEVEDARIWKWFVGTPKQWEKEKEIKVSQQLKKTKK
jgi:hypothetical protein